MDQHHLWEDIREDLRGLFVGERTLGDSFVAPIAFVVVYALSSLGPAAAAALVAGGLVAAWRVRKGQEVVYAVAGIGAIGFAAFLALRSGRPESFFLPGIVGAAAMAVLALVSILVGRPLSAWSSWSYRKWPLEWYWRQDVRPAYTAVTAVWALYFVGRAGLQWIFYVAERPEALAAAKVATSWPTIIPLLIATYAYGNRRLHKLGGPTVAEFEAAAEGPYTGRQRGF